MSLKLQVRKMYLDIRKILIPQLISDFLLRPSTENNIHHKKVHTGYFGWILYNFTILYFTQYCMPLTKSVRL